MPDFDQYPALEDMAGLWLADSPPALWWRLVWTSGLKPSANHWDAAALFRNVHDKGQPGAMETALLLCTDYRWADATRRLVADIARSGILTDDELVALAEQFLEDPLRWVLPDELTAGPWISIPLTEDEDGEEQDGEKNCTVMPDDSSSDKPIWMARTVKPPLRRWAAATILRRDPARLGPLLARAEELSARDAAVVMAGAIDARDAFDERGAARLIELGLSWPAPSVRLLALQILADRDGLEAAQRRAAQDPSAKVRVWAERPHPAAGGPRTPRGRRQSGKPSPAPPVRAGGDNTRPPATQPEPEPADQPSLFDLA